MSDLRRKKLYVIFSQHLQILREAGLTGGKKIEAANPYLCPICFNEFTEEHLDTSLDNHLTLEDAPPKSLGGRANLLTCKRCNNTCGHKIDAHLANRLKELDQSKFFTNTESKVKVDKDGIRVNGTMKVDENGTMQMHHSPDNNNPETLKSYIAGVKKDSIINLTFMPSRVNDDRLKIALLKTGYLLLFRQYGYTLIFGREFDRIREQLQFPERLIYPLDFWFLGPFPKELTETIPFIVEKGLGSILPFFELTTEHSSYIFGTILPINDLPIEEAILKFKMRFDEVSEFHVDMHKFNPETDFLHSKDNIAELLEFVKTINS